METIDDKSVRPLSSTDGEAVLEIAEEREDATQTGQSESASHELEVDDEELEATARHPRTPKACGTREGYGTRARASPC